jgi:hypothetical protein
LVLELPEVELLADDDDIEVEVGDTVTYASAENPDERKDDMHHHASYRP